MRLVYVHGFNSSPASYKAQALASYLACHAPKLDYQVPQLSHWPQTACQTLVDTCCASAGPVLLVGSSLGGFYSHWLLAKGYAHKAVLINPAVWPTRLLPAYLGPQQNLYTQETYQLTQAHLEQIADLELPTCSPKIRAQLRVFLQTGDEVLDYRQALDYFSPAACHLIQGGDHGFQDFDAYIPSLLAFLIPEYFTKTCHPH
ncbi:hypothetical protein SAMN05421831_101389 [Allopseudospirillum japonicum]|uniref:Esterase n=1 Tax=Allopseudospirillum japonicum TaxID=64971 RepID=A0A1H6QKH9_9GAMM|nr:YqiA/YcfP family alpha/beta fold hydrolase [Allopseudospirillum japonicum]SEI41454.1 hypothetical protein SAMN05421831_101389 [Allopseudospirillum japonicum]